MSEDWHARDDSRSRCFRGKTFKLRFGFVYDKKVITKKTVRGIRLSRAREIEWVPAKIRYGQKEKYAHTKGQVRFPGSVIVPDSVTAGFDFTYTYCRTNYDLFKI